MKLIFALALLVSSHSAFAVLDGNEVQDDSIIRKVTVQLVGADENDHIRWGCSGTIIGQRRILTAAHCLQRQPYRIWVRFSEGDGRYVSIKANHLTYNEDYKFHPNLPFNGDNSYLTGDVNRMLIFSANDLGILTLSQDIPDFARVAEFFTEGQLLHNGGYFYIAGYGMRNRGASHNEVFNNPTLKYSRERFYRVDQDVAAANDVSGEPAEGDSGGPAFVVDGDRIFVLGVLSSGAEAKKMSTIALVPYFQAWIDSH